MFDLSIAFVRPPNSLVRLSAVTPPPLLREMWGPPPPPVGDDASAFQCVWGERGETRESLPVQTLICLASPSTWQQPLPPPPPPSPLPSTPQSSLTESPPLPPLPHAEGVRVFVGRLAPHTTRASLSAYFVDLLSSQGVHDPGHALLDVYLPNDVSGKTRHFAFVTFRDALILNVVLAEKAPHVVDGAAIVIDAAAPRQGPAFVPRPTPHSYSRGAHPAAPTNNGWGGSTSTTTTTAPSSGGTPSADVGVVRWIPRPAPPPLTEGGGDSAFRGVGSGLLLMAERTGAFRVPGGVASGLTEGGGAPSPQQLALLGGLLSPSPEH